MKTDRNPSERSCRCPMCESRFTTEGDVLRLQVREFQVCLCSADCARTLLAQPDECIAKWRQQMRCIGSADARCPLAGDGCPWQQLQISAGRHPKSTKTNDNER